MSAHDFFVYVPENAAAEKPIGLVVLINYKTSESLPTPVLPQFNDANCALVVCKTPTDAMATRAGLSLDVVHNMRQQYAIDPKRVYIFGFDKEATGQRLALAYPDVFTGAFLAHIEPYRQVRSKGGGFYDAKIPKPDAKSFELAKTHPFYIGSANRGEAWELYANAMKQDGFKLVKFSPLTGEQIHYPNYTSDWLPGVFKFLDDATAKLTVKPSTAPTTKSSTKPAK